MGLQESRAFVLLTYPIQEADKLCVLFTERFGKVRGVAKGAKRPGSRFGASLEPLSEVQVTFYQKEHGELVSFGSCELVQSYFKLESRPEGEAAVHYMAELIDHLMPSAEPNEKVYKLIRAVLGGISQDMDVNGMLLYFNVWMLKLSGFFPHLEHCIRCRRTLATDEMLYLTSDGSPECADCKGSSEGITLSPLLRAEVQRILTQSPIKWSGPAVPTEALSRLQSFVQMLVHRILEKRLRAERFVRFQF
jgi:DNA repair protein RecO (recombination protein O)